MRRHVFAAVVCSSLFFLGSDWCQAQLIDPRAQQVALQSLATMQYQSQLLDGTLAHGTITQDGETGTIVVKTKGPAVRYEVSLPSKQFVTVFSNGSAKRTQAGKSHPLPTWVADWKRTNHLPARSRLADINLPNTRLEFIGVESISGRPTDHLRISAVPIDGTPPELLERVSEFHVFIDQAALVVVKTISYDFCPDAMENRTPVETFYSDYRMVNGVPLSFHQTHYVGGQVQSDIVFDSIQIGISNPASDF